VGGFGGVDRGSRNDKLGRINKRGVGKGKYRFYRRVWVVEIKF